jgi:CubicO group peptidase (beta-lactamase class C family)
VFRIFSMTKAVGSTAAMILMDRGKLDPNTPVEEILPEYAKVQVLEGLLLTQSLPFVEPRFMDTYEKFERTAYAQ